MSISQRTRALAPLGKRVLSRDRGQVSNTINICIGHKPFLGSKLGYVDVMLSPVSIAVDGPFKVFVIDDAQFGEYGHTLSEYSQLLWLNDRFDEVVQGHEFVRLFQYRKFVTAAKLGGESIWPHTRWLPPEELGACAPEFNRHCNRELVSKPLGLAGQAGGAAMQYTLCHKIEDLLLFSLFLVRESMLSETSAAEFITRPDLIPSATIGTFHRETLKDVLEKLALAAKFIDAPEFIPRDGIQRRNAGFLLERLHSHLIYLHMRNRGTNFANGQIIVLNKSPVLEISQ